MQPKTGVSESGWKLCGYSSLKGLRAGTLDQLAQYDKDIDTESLDARVVIDEPVEGPFTGRTCLQIWNGTKVLEFPMSYIYDVDFDEEYSLTQIIFDKYHGDGDVKDEMSVQVKRGDVVRLNFARGDFQDCLLARNQFLYAVAKDHDAKDVLDRDYLLDTIGWA